MYVQLPSTFPLYLLHPSISFLLSSATFMLVSFFFRNSSASLLAFSRSAGEREAAALFFAAFSLSSFSTSCFFSSSLLPRHRSSWACARACCRSLLFCLHADMQRGARRNIAGMVEVKTKSEERRSRSEKKRGEARRGERRGERRGKRENQESPRTKENGTGGKPKKQEAENKTGNKGNK
mmetsp:Transcript_28765/g.73594  ORF Transcript_28765/g.73594 Transcript_28765/m.73594 type:complete len:180 (-) Transcript_28765:1133-1672(-)